MLPNNTPSSFAVGGYFLPPDDREPALLVDYELGGTALNDGSAGMMVQVWKISYLDGTDVVVEPEVAGSPTTLFSTSGIAEIALAFDQNMRAHVAYRVGTNLFLRWYDSVTSGYVITDFGPGKNPRLSLDDKRPSQVQSSDVIFAFIQDGELAYRQQRDRFEIKYVLKTGVEANVQLKAIGMNSVLRMQFELA